ncbi:MAG: polysaccharide deacetylase family protein [Candidatus Riflebacteria bacterium]|nr:polysaccharide deacetylase family protein [Candidatus Riflebacteria bacterium]
MKGKIFFFAAMLVFFVNNCTSGYEKLPVIVYHHIEDPVKSDVSCTPENFSSQMQMIKKSGFTPLTLNEARLFIGGALRRIKNPILITFDDGYQSVYKHGFPILEKFHVPATVFVVTSRIGQKPQFSRYLSESEISEMANSGLISFGSHTDNLHTDIIRIKNSFKKKPDPVEELLKNDLQKSSSRLEKITNTKIFALAWPYGKHDDITTRIARECGFQVIFTSRSGFSEASSDPFEIKRIPVTSKDTPESVIKKIMGK